VGHAAVGCWWLRQPREYRCLLGMADTKPQRRRTKQQHTQQLDTTPTRPLIITPQLVMSRTTTPKPQSIILPRVLHHEGSGVLHHEGSGVLHHEGSGVLHHEGSGVLHHEGSGVLHHEGSGVLHHDVCCHFTPKLLSITPKRLHITLKPALPSVVIPRFPSTTPPRHPSITPQTLPDFATRRFLNARAEISISFYLNWLIVFMINGHWELIVDLKWENKNSNKGNSFVRLW
jgi:hypothetical protein